LSWESESAEKDFSENPPHYTVSKEFEETTREYIARRVEDGEMVFHCGVNIAFDIANNSLEEKRAFGLVARKRNKLVTQVIFLQNYSRIGGHAFMAAINLVVIDIN